MVAAVFSAEKTSGGDALRRGWGNAACGQLHLISQLTPTASPQGEAFWGSGSQESLPLEGKVLSKAKRMRCSRRSGVILPARRRSRAAARHPARFAAAKRRRYHTAGRLRSNRARKARKKEPERRCASLLAAAKFPALFHIACGQTFTSATQVFEGARGRLLP